MVIEGNRIGASGLRCEESTGGAKVKLEVQVGGCGC